MPFRSNFNFLQPYNQQLFDLVFSAEKYYQDDPNTCLMKLGQFAELITEKIAHLSNISLTNSDLQRNQEELTKKSQNNAVIPLEIQECLNYIQDWSNRAFHNFSHPNYDFKPSAWEAIQKSYRISFWLCRIFYNHTNPISAIIEPTYSPQRSDEMIDQLSDRLREFTIVSEQIINEQKNSEENQQHLSHQLLLKQQEIETLNQQIKTLQKETQQDLQTQLSSKEEKINILTQELNHLKNAYYQEIKHFSQELKDEQKNSLAQEITILQAKLKREKQKTQKLSKWLKLTFLTTVTCVTLIGTVFLGLVSWSFIPKSPSHLPSLEQKNK